MSQRDETAADIWNETKKMGRVRYALSYGTAFGLILFVFTSLLELMDYSFSDIFLTPATAYRFAIWIACGIIGYGTIMWSVKEFIYRKK